MSDLLMSAIGGCLDASGGDIFKAVQMMCSGKCARALALENVALLVRLGATFENEEDMAKILDAIGEDNVTPDIIDSLFRYPENPLWIGEKDDGTMIGLVQEIKDFLLDTDMDDIVSKEYKDTATIKYEANGTFFEKA